MPARTTTPEENFIGKRRVEATLEVEQRGPDHVFVVTITSIRSFQVFDTVEALTRGGPSKSTYVMVYAIFEKGVKQNLLGVGSALTVVFLAFVLILTITQVYFVNRRVHYT